MTESSNSTNPPAPKKRIELSFSFKDVTTPGKVELFIGVQGMRKPEQRRKAPVGQKMAPKWVSSPGSRRLDVGQFRLTNGHPGMGGNRDIFRLKGQKWEMGQEKVRHLKRRGLGLAPDPGAARYLSVRNFASAEGRHLELAEKRDIADSSVLHGRRASAARITRSKGPQSGSRFWDK
jgi:hypothetical protein